MNSLSVLNMSAGPRTKTSRLLGLILEPLLAAQRLRVGSHIKGMGRSSLKVIDLIAPSSSTCRQHTQNTKIALGLGMRTSLPCGHKELLLLLQAVCDTSCADHAQAFVHTYGHAASVTQKVLA